MIFESPPFLPSGARRYACASSTNRAPCRASTNSSFTGSAGDGAGDDFAISGIIYVTGPAGSGKTTLLYSVLAELNDPDVSISTAEDPIEYDLPRANQVQASKEIGLDYVRILRAFLHQDPDIILVGETRNKETAQIAVEAALTGHLVFTTLHTHDAAGVFTRLGEMGVGPFLASSSTLGAIAQRLTRRLCQSCKESYTPDDISLTIPGPRPEQAVHVLPPSWLRPVLGNGLSWARGCLRSPAHEC